MVTYVQIGKKPRMAINDTIANIRTDFIKQIPKLGWKPVPIYFYATAKSKWWKGVLVPYKWKIKEVHYSFYWVSEYEYWNITEDRKDKVKLGTVGWENMEDTFKKYREKGYEL